MGVTGSRWIWTEPAGVPIRFSVVYCSSMPGNDTFGGEEMAVCSAFRWPISVSSDLCGADTIAAFVFGSIKLCVGKAKEFVEARGVRSHHGHAYRNV